ncbi:MAG: ribbon-helix-helix domain-containing protein [Propionibacteriaceae bacterium]|nr:ribbon-helix-helix domain-containing protein [Propionibacteriaceae bacterium]
MTGKDTFTEAERAQFEASAAEAETGYDIEFLRSLPRVTGRPLSVGEKAAAVVPVRLDDARIKALDARAKATHTSRSQIIRDAIDHELALAAA